MAEGTGSENSLGRDLAVFFGLIFLLVVAAFGLLGELFAAATLLPWFLAAVLLIGVGAAEIGRRWLHSRGLRVAGLVFALAFAALRLVELNPVKPFRALYRSLEQGMTERQVIDLLERRFPVDGRFSLPEVSHLPDGTLILTLDRHKADYDSEIIQVQLADRKVEKFIYLID